MTATASTEADMFFATHDTWGIVDTGATKTVMGSSHVKEFLENLHPQVKPHVRRSSSNVVFRFGNQGTLKATHALVVPVCGMWLKISVVAGSTPFLISNTLLRALGAMIDTNNHQLILKNHNTNIPLQLSQKGLYLMNMNDLLTISPVPGSHEAAAETYAQDDHSSGQKNAVSQTSASIKVPLATTAKISDAPVTNRIDSANPFVQKVFAQETDTNQRSLHPIRSHGQLCPALDPCSSQPAISRTGVHRAPDKGEPQGRSDELWKEPFGQNVRGDVGVSPRLDSMVHSTLPQQHQAGTPEDDSLHRSQDRGVRSQRGTVLADASAQSQSKESPQVIGSQAKDDGRAQHSAGVEPGDRHRDLRDDERVTLGERNSDPGGDPEHPGEDDRAGDSHATDDCPDVSGAHDAAAAGAFNVVRNCHSGMGGPMEPVNEENSCGDWALRAGEIDQFCNSIPNSHQVKFWETVEMIEHELAQTAKIIQPCSKSIDLLEVFCSSESMLTAQVNQQGGNAKRFGYDQGDLMQTEGRRELFASVIRYQPKHIWMSPTCGPWSKWSAFNSQRSIQAWDQTQQDRIQMLTQIALCLVLSRHQHRCQRHAHWEQPKGSLMMKIPPVQEVHRYMVVAKPDLCRAGNLQDPQNKMPIKKGLEIHTTSMRLYDALDPLRCNRSHEHQVIEGSTVSQGMTVSRSQFSELYPRKFARLIAQTLLKQRFPLEKPVGSIADPALMCFDAITADVLAASVRERPAKRIRKAPNKGTKVPAATGALGQPGETKRQRLNPPEVSTEQHDATGVSTDQQKAEAILKRIEAILPRVGKKRIDSPTILQELHQVFPGFKIVQLIAGKGTDRLFEPPKEITPEEAPYRRSIMRLRQDQQVILDDSWEKYDMLSKRQLIRKSPACRVNITMFAAKEIESHPSPLIELQAAPPPNADSVPESSAVDPLVSLPSIEPMNADMPENSSIQHERPPLETDVEHTEKLGTQPDEHQADDHHMPEAKTGHGPRFRALPEEEQAMIKRAHQNLCHPSPEQLSAVLKTQGCRPEVYQAVFDMECPTCASCQKPKISRPSSLKDSLDFNDKVFIDGISWTAKNGVMYHFYHLLDQATNYHVAIPAPSRSADQAISKVSDAWFLWAGPPNALIMDAATEFTSEEFGNFLQRHEVKGITTSPHAHWQNGRCERHGQILQNMLNKLDHESPITTFKEFQQALIQCTHAKNTLSIRAGFAPEVLVFGKCSKLPGSVVSSEDVSAHASANRDDAQGIAFRQNLALRERARIAFHRADNDMALRRACLRRTRPDRQGYDVGEWVMMWQPQKENNGYWFGPLKIIQQEKNLSVWATAGGKLHRRAPEHVRPVSSAEARRLPEVESEIMQNPATNPVPATEIPQANLGNSPEDPNNISNNNPMSEDNTSQSQDQPDNEPEGMNSDENPNENENTLEPPSTIHIDTPIPESEEDDHLVTSHLLCCDDEIHVIDPIEEPCAWRCEFEVPRHCVGKFTKETPADEILLATTEKKQRTEVKLSLLAPEEKAAFQAAKQTEVQNWLTTGTVSKILRSKLAPEQILRCRWLLVWKEKDLTQKNEIKEHQGLSKLHTHKAKARLVVLGYLDPNLTEVPRDSPTLGRQSKMLLLQLIASNGWSLGSFDIRAAFLQGRTQKDRVMGIEPVPELAEALKLKPDEVCKLDKSAYGLIDAPFLWFQTLCEELALLGMTPSPFDPCMFILRHPKTGALSGALGVHVDDGIYGGDDYFHQQIQKLEQKYPFGSKKSRSFTFTGIDMQQQPDNSIRLSQAKYVNNISPISIKPDRRQNEDEKVTEEERHQLRGLVGSLQYAAVHTRPDISSALSHLQSQINQAKVSTLITANKVLHSAKKHSDVCIQIQPIAIKDVRFIAFSDASFASKSKPESHAGMIILATHKEISQNKSCAISPLSWGTKKIQRIVTSTLSAETSALSTALDQLTWLRLYWAWILDPKTEWQRPEKVTNLPPAITIPTYKIDSQDLAITDCKSLYDLTTRTAIPNCSEFRTQLLARSIKDILSEGIKLHWVHSGAQLADALTKVMEANFLRETLRQGKYCLHDSNEVLKNRASARNRLKWLKTSTDQMCI